MAILHRGGGVITSISAIAHDTYKKVASWHFIGNVKWQDGSASQELQIHPSSVCYDDTIQDSKIKVHGLMDELTDYLNHHGTWHDDKHTRDGRVYRWTPHKPEHREEITPVS